MDLLTLLRDYGWVGVVLVWLLPKVWQFFADRYFPEKVAETKREAESKRERDKREQDRRDDALQAEREARALLLKSQIDRETQEFEHHKQIDNRVATAIENMGTVIQQMSLAVTVGNERITQLISAHSRHDNFTFTAHVEMKEKMEQIEQMIDTRKKVEELESELHDTQRKMKAAAPDNSEQKADDAVQ